MYFPPLDTPKGLGWGYCFSGGTMPSEPTVKRTVTFIDYQNLYHLTRAAFGYSNPECDLVALAARLAGRRGDEILGRGSSLPGHNVERD